MRNDCIREESPEELTLGELMAAVQIVSKQHLGPDQNRLSSAKMSSFLFRLFSFRCRTTPAFIIAVHGGEPSPSIAATKSEHGVVRHTVL